MTTTIMVVDDNETTRRMVRGALTRAGYHVVEAADGSSARKLMVSARPRLVLQDIVLPDVDGFQLVGELRTLAPDASILAFSGFLSKLDEARISAVGFDHIIPKPIAPSALIPIVEAHLPQTVASGDKFGAGRRVLIVDDDPMQLKLAWFRLGRLGFEVDTAADGVAALAHVKKRRPDAIVSDVMMPELDGFGLAMAIRKDPELASIPVVLVTSSFVEPTDRELARRAGANELVVRTPELAELITVLRGAISGATPASPIDASEIDDLERERTRRVFRQLERQVNINTGLAKRCSALASELTVLTGIADTVLKHRDVDGALEEALSACFDAGGVPVGALYQIDDNREVRVRALGETGGELVLRGLGSFFGHPRLLQRVMDSGQPIYLPSDDVAPEIASEILAACEARAVLVVPLTSATGPLGALLMVSRGRELDERDWRVFAAGVGAQLSQVLRLAKAYGDAEAAERKAESHAALLAAVFESAPDHVVHVDRDGKIRFINRTPSLATSNHLLGRDWIDLLLPDQRPAAKAALEASQAGAISEIETSAQRGDGTVSFYQCRIGPIRQDGAITGCVIVARDVTDKKLTEMQLMLADRMASVGTLAAGVAHEINNPLAAVLANLDMALADLADLPPSQLPKDVLEELADARGAAERVREIVRDLKLFSRTHEDPFGAVDVEKVLDSTLRMAWNELRHRAKLVKVYGKVPRVVGNESRLGQVLLNLIVNAVQAIPEGKYQDNEICVSTSASSTHVLIAIRDTGGGMPSDVKQRIFTPFFTTKPIGVGTGLGLAISHRIVTAMGGTISFDSDPGSGTESRISIPIAAPNVPPVTRKLPTLASPTRRGHVLVIDDEESIGVALRRYLSQEHDVEAVTSARVALDKIAAGTRYDVIVCDLMMPQITAIELHQQVMKLDPLQASRIVFVTGGAFTESARTFFETTSNPRIEKPFDLKAMRDLINGMVR